MDKKHQIHKLPEQLKNDLREKGIIIRGGAELDPEVLVRALSAHEARVEKDMKAMAT